MDGSIFKKLFENLEIAALDRRRIIGGHRTCSFQSMNLIYILWKVKRYSLQKQLTDLAVVDPGCSFKKLVHEHLRHPSAPKILGAMLR